VSLWEDQSANGRDFAQTVDANRPTYNTDEILFTRANSDVLEIIGSASADWVKDFHDGTLTTVEVCIKAYSNSGNGGMMGTSRGSPTAKGFSLYFLDLNKNLTVLVGHGTQSVVTDDSDSDYWVEGTSYEWFRYTANLNEAVGADRSTLYDSINNSSNNTLIASPATGDAVEDIQIGAVGNNVLLLEGGIKEIIIVNRALTAQEWIDIKLR